MNQDLSLNPRELLAALAKARSTLVVLIVVGLLGYTGYQIAHIASVQASSAYITAQENQSKVPNLHVNKAVIDQLEQLHSTGSTTVPITTGKQNPFTFE